MSDTTRSQSSIQLPVTPQAAPLTLLHAARELAARQGIVPR